MALICASTQGHVLLRQERARELAAHEEQLEEWKTRFKAEALRKIGEREKALADWQAQLEGSRSELEHLKESVEVRMLRRRRHCPWQAGLERTLSSAKTLPETLSSALQHSISCPVN